MREPREAATVALLAQLRALDQAMAVAQFAPDGVLLRANAHYRMLLAQATDTAGTDAAPLDPASLPHPVADVDFWTALRQGHAHAELAERECHDGSRRWLHSSYVPVRDDQGRVSQILETVIALPDPVLQAREQQVQARRLSLAADAVDAAIVIGDAQGRILYTNAAFTRMFGWQGQEVQGREAGALLSTHLDGPAAAASDQAALAASPFGREALVTGKDGQRYWVKAEVKRVDGADGALPYTVTVLTDITLTKMHDALQHRVLEAMAHETPLSEVLKLICLEVERLEPQVAATILEVDAQGLLHPLAAPSMPSHYSQQLDGLAIGPSVGSCGTAAWRNEPVLVEDIATDPLWAPYRELILPLGYTGCWSTPIHSSQGTVIGTFAFYFSRPRNKSAAEFHQRLVQTCTHLCALALQRERQRQHIRQLAFYDSLTALPNRSLLQAKADQAIAVAARNQETLALLFVDLDRFKQVNDSLGHAAGDELLRQVASKLQFDLRGSDIVGRLSGDEFVMVLPRCDANQAARAIERLQALLAEPTTIAGSPLAVSASVGVAMFPDDGRDMETLLHRADMAMYQAKSGGRSQSRFFSTEMNRSAQERLSLETALRQTLKEGGLRLHYQPQIDLARGVLHGVEALARWSDPTLGEITPARFIPLAEECGLIAALGHWAISEACRQLALWRAQGLHVPSVSVNLSQISFNDLELPNTLLATLRRHGLQPKDLTLELTESVLLDTNPSTMATIAAIHAQGVRLSMDDFGTGYSSLSYLRHLPVQELKLDRTFVADLETSEVARALSSAILSIGKSLRLTVVAEGVETAAQERLLREQGYPVAQGYALGRPMPPDELPAWVACSLAAGTAVGWNPQI